MGKTKTKLIDDSLPQEEVKKTVSKGQPKDELVEKLKAELGIEKEVSREERVSQVPRTTPTKVKPRSKKYQEKVQDLDKSKTYPLNEALDLVKKDSYTKFDGTLEIHINTIQTGMRGLVSLPFASGKIEYKTEAKGKVIHLGLGKLTQPTEELSANVKTLLQTLGKTRVKKVTLSPTMGPSVKLDLSSL